MSYMDIPYSLGEKSAVPLCKFISIWKVQSNNTYQVSKSAGFVTPGLFITYEGNGVISLADDHYDLYPGSFFFVKEAIPSTYKCKNNNWKFYFIDFSSLDMPHFLHLPVGEILSTAKLPEVLQLCEKIIETLIAQPAGYAYSANILLQEVLLLLAREQSFLAAPNHTEMDRILYFIHKNLNKPIQIDELVQKSGLSRTYFFARFRTMTGHSPTSYMLKLKLESAKVSLETTNLPVKEIAAVLHFYDEFHFSKLFKKQYGMPPSVFRRQ